MSFGQEKVVLAFWGLEMCIITTVERHQYTVVYTKLLLDHRILGSHVQKYLSSGQSVIFSEDLQFSQ